METWSPQRQPGPGQQNDANFQDQANRIACQEQHDAKKSKS